MRFLLTGLVAIVSLVVVWLFVGAIEGAYLNAIAELRAVLP